MVVGNEKVVEAAQKVGNFSDQYFEIMEEGRTAKVLCGGQPSIWIWGEPVIDTTGTGVFGVAWHYGSSGALAVVCPFIMISSGFVLS